MVVYCLTPPSYYLNPCWFTVEELLWHTFHGNIYMNTQDINLKVTLEIYILEIRAKSPTGQWFYICWRNVIWYHGCIGSDQHLNKKLYLKMHLKIFSVKYQPLCWDINISIFMIWGLGVKIFCGNKVNIMLHFFLGFQWDQLHWYWLCKIKESMSSMRKDFNYRHCLSVKLENVKFVSCIKIQYGRVKLQHIIYSIIANGAMKREYVWKR